MSSRSIESTAARKLVGARIAQARRDVGWAQEQLAEKLGLDSITVSRIETGRRQLTVVLAMQIVDVLGTTVNRIMGRNGPPTDLVEEVAALLDRMPPGRKATGLEMLRVLSREKAQSE